MYVKLFTKILDSSIWLAPDPHRLVWITLLAAADQEGNAMFASVANVAARARVSLDEARSAMASFEGPDLDSADPDNEGRRVERFPGGWHILNFAKYRDLVKAEQIREQTRERVRRHRAKKAGNGEVTHANASVTTSEAYADTEAKAKNTGAPRAASRPSVSVADLTAEGVDPQHAADWLKARGKVPLTETAWNAVKREAGLAAMSPAEAVKMAAESQWRGFKADWVHSRGRKVDALGAANLAAVQRLKARHG